MDGVTMATTVMPLNVAHHYSLEMFSFGTIPFLIVSFIWLFSSVISCSERLSQISDTFNKTVEEIRSSRIISLDKVKEYQANFYETTDLFVELIRTDKDVDLAPLQDIISNLKFFSGQYTEHAEFTDYYFYKLSQRLGHFYEEFFSRASPENHSDFDVLRYHEPFLWNLRLVYQKYRMQENKRNSKHRSLAEGDGTFFKEAGGELLNQEDYCQQNLEKLLGDFRFKSLEMAIQNFSNFCSIMRSKYDIPGTGTLFFSSQQPNDLTESNSASQISIHLSTIHKAADISIYHECLTKTDKYLTKLEDLKKIKSTAAWLLSMFFEEPGSNFLSPWDLDWQWSKENGLCPLYHESSAKNSIALGTEENEGKSCFDIKVKYKEKFNSLLESICNSNFFKACHDKFRWYMVVVAVVVVLILRRCLRKEKIGHFEEDLVPTTKSRRKRKHCSAQEYHDEESGPTNSYGDCIYKNDEDNYDRY